jgi:hypothetical protein
LLAGLLLALAACPAQRRAFSRDALLRELAGVGRDRIEPVTDLDLVRRERLGVPAARPASLDAPPAWIARLPAVERARWHTARGDALTPALAQSLRALPDGLAHLCLRAREEERMGAVLEECAAFIESAPADPRVPAAAALLAEVRELALDVDDLFAERGAAWVQACGARGGEVCADLALVVADAQRVAASRAKDAARAEAAVHASGRLTKARVVGPFAGDNLYTFASAGAGRGLVAAARSVERDLEPWSGRFTPALRSDPGLYRLSIEGAGAGPAWLYLRSSSSARVVVDGVVVAERMPGLRHESRVSRVAVHLRPGRHRVEVLCWASGRAGAVELALLDDAGRPALKEVRPASPSAPGAGVSATSSPPVRGRGGGEPEDLMSLEEELWRGHLASWGLGVDDGELTDIARRLFSIWSFSPLAASGAARALLEVGPRQVAEAEASRLYERVKGAWPDHPGAIRHEAQRAEEDRPDEALALYRILSSARPDHPDGHLGVLERTLELGLLDEASAAAAALLALRPRPGRMAPVGWWLDRTGRLEELARFDLRTASEQPWLYSPARARFFLEAGETEAALVALEEVTTAEPGHVALELYWDLLELRDVVATEERLRAHLALFPNDRAAWRRSVRLAARARGTDAALEQVAAAQGRFGVDEELDALAAELGVEPAWAPALARGDEAITRWRTAPDPRFAGYPVVALVDHRERQMTAEGGARVIRHWIVALGSKEALDQFGEISVDDDAEIVRLRVLKPDGSVRLPERRAGVPDVSLTGLEVGDLVELLWVVREDAPAARALSFELLPLVDTSPAVSRAYTVQAPRFLWETGRLKALAYEGAPAAHVQLDDEFARIHFAAEGVGPSFAEPHAPAFVESVPSVGFALDVDDERWRARRGATLEQNAVVEPWLERAALSIAGEGTPMARWARLFRFVVRRIEPAGAPALAPEVLLEGRGRRGPLLLALARAAKLRARPVALHLPALPEASVPTASTWGVSGVAVSLGRRESLAFVDDGLAVLDELPRSARGAALLDLSVEEPQTLELEDAHFTDRKVQVKVDLEWKREGRLDGFIALTVPAHIAEPLRRQLRASSRSERRAAFEGALATSFPGVKVTDVAAPTLNNPGTALGLGVTLQVPVNWDGATPVRLEHIFAHAASARFGLFAPLVQYLQVAERQRPALFLAADERLAFELSLPPGAAFTEVPARLEESVGPVSLDQRAEVTDGTLFWTRELSYETARVAPDEWARLQPRLAALAGLLDATVAFVVPEAPAPHAEVSRR